MEQDTMMHEATFDPWGSDPVHTPWDWRQEVASDSTRLGYWDWVAVQREIDAEEAEG